MAVGLFQGVPGGTSSSQEFAAHSCPRGCLHTKACVLTCPATDGPCRRLCRFFGDDRLTGGSGPVGLDGLGCSERPASACGTDSMRGVLLDRLFTAFALVLHCCDAIARTPACTHQCEGDQTATGCATEWIPNQVASGWSATAHPSRMHSKGRHRTHAGPYIQASCVRAYTAHHCILANAQRHAAHIQ